MSLIVNSLKILGGSVSFASILLKSLLFIHLLPIPLCLHFLFTPPLQREYLHSILFCFEGVLVQTVFFYLSEVLHIIFLEMLFDFFFHQPCVVICHHVKHHSCFYCQFFLLFSLVMCYHFH